MQHEPITIVQGANSPAEWFGLQRPAVERLVVLMDTELKSLHAEQTNFTEVLAKVVDGCYDRQEEAFCVYIIAQSVTTSRLVSQFQNAMLEQQTAWNELTEDLANELEAERSGRTKSGIIIDLSKIDP